MLTTTLLLAFTTASEPALPPLPPIPKDEPEVLLPQPKGKIVELPSAPLLPPKPVRLPTMREFAAQFEPLPGVHEVTVIHPLSGKPVDVVFRLPAGKPRKVHTYPRSIVFEYDRKDVVLIFRLFGQVDVRYN